MLVILSLCQIFLKSSVHDEINRDTCYHDTRNIRANGHVSVSVSRLGQDTAIPLKRSQIHVFKCVRHCCTPEILYLSLLSRFHHIHGCSVVKLQRKSTK